MACTSGFVLYFLALAGVMMAIRACFCLPSLPRRRFSLCFLGVLVAWFIIVCAIAPVGVEWFGELVILRNPLLVKDLQRLFSPHFNDQKPNEFEAETLPAIFGHHVTATGCGFQTSYHAIHEAKILQNTTQFRPHPHRPNAVFIVLKYEESTPSLRVESCAFNHAHQCFRSPIAIYVARVEAINGVGQRPSIGCRVCF